MIGPVLFALAVVALWRSLRGVSPRVLVDQIVAWGPWRVLVALGLSAAALGLLCLLEWLALRWAGTPRPWRSAAFLSLVVNGITHSLGANVVVATLARAWAYERVNVGLVTSMATTVFSAVSFAMGLAALVGGGLLVAQPAQLLAAGFPPPIGRLIGGGLLVAVAIYVAACATLRSPRLRGLSLPPVRYAVAQVVIGVLDNALSSTLLWFLIGPDRGPYATFVFAYALACLLGLASTIPAGLGVFETVLIALLADTARPALAAGLIGFRLFSYVAPFLLSLVLVLVDRLMFRPRFKREAVQ